MAGLLAAVLAPEADIHVFEVFPGGRSGDLFEALDMCVTAQADIVVLGLGVAMPSWLIARKIEEAREYGVACIAAVGNNTGPVSFRPTSRACSVLDPSASGTSPTGQLPRDTVHLGEPNPEGFFPARFSADRPGIDLCAPGVAVASAVPPHNIRAMDGTALAAAHVAALAALVLAHHPDFAGARDPGRMRVERLFAVLCSSCQPLPYSDRAKVGWGVPDVVSAVGLTRSAWAYGVPAPGLGLQWRREDDSTSDGAAVSGYEHRGAIHPVGDEIGERRVRLGQWIVDGLDPQPMRPRERRGTRGRRRGCWR